jgi:glycolate oxidase FAD binding subunit
MRINAVPSKVAGLMEAIARALPTAQIEAHPVTGACHVVAEDAGAIEIVRRMNAACLVQRCPAELKRDIDVFGDQPSSLALMQAIKQQFDPNGTLSPGRFVGGL